MEDITPADIIRKVKNDLIITDEQLDSFIPYFGNLADELDSCGVQYLIVANDLRRVYHKLVAMRADRHLHKNLVTA